MLQMLAIANQPGREPNEEIGVRRAQGEGFLTPAAAVNLGRVLRFVRNAADLTLRDVASRADLSPQYVQNLERGERTSGSERAYLALANGYGLRRDAMLDLLLKFQVASALERRGIDAEVAEFVWRGIEGRLAEKGVFVRTSPAELASEVFEAAVLTTSQRE